MKNRIIIFVFTLILIISAKLFAQPYLRSDPLENVIAYKITSYIDKEQSKGYDPNTPLFIDPNFTILAEDDGSLNFNLNKIEENIIYYLTIRCCYKNFCGKKPVYIVIHRRIVPPTPEVTITDTHLIAAPQENVVYYKVISSIDPNSSPWYDPNITPYLDSNITIAVNEDGSLNYDLSEFEAGISYSLKIFCCNDYMCGYPAYVILFKYPIIPPPLNVYITKEGLYGREFFYSVINFDE